MIKKIFLTLVLTFGITLSASAVNMETIQYKNINNNDNIINTENGNWQLANKKYKEYFTKKVSAGSGSFSEFYSPNGTFLFSTGCNYEFIHNGSLIGYSNSELKFYEFTMNKGILEQRELTESEIKNLFKDFQIVKISEFVNTTNSLRIKTDKKHLKIILWNDTDRYFYNYSFSSNNAKFNTYPLRGFLNITQKGMIQFSHFGDNTKENPWFILFF